MTTWIGLIRGINVGGKNRLPMSSLKNCLEALHCTNIETYIQSGNVVFDSSAKNGRKLGEGISRQVATVHGFRPPVVVRSLDEWRRVVEANPFPSAVSDPKSLHFYFLDESPQTPNIEALHAACTPTEKYVLDDRVFYLHAPDGIGRSKLAASVERHLGVVATARNYRTVEKLLAIANRR